MASALKLHVCESFFAEASALQRDPEFAELDLRSFPARCGQPPLSLSELAPSAADDPAESCVACIGSMCITQLAKSPEAEATLNLAVFEQCFSLLVPEAQVVELLNSGAYLCSPGWLKEWSSKLEQYGTDQGLLRQMFHETTSRIVLLDTGIDPQSHQHLQEFADYLDLPAETLHVGLDHLRLRIHNLLLQHQLKQARKLAVTTAESPAADYAMALDLLSEIPRSEREEAVLERIEIVISMLFAPLEYSLLTLVDGEPAQLRSHESSEPATEVRERLLGRERSYGVTEEGYGFFFTIGDQERNVALVEITNCAHHESIERYLNLCLSIRGIFNLALTNARIFTRHLETTEQLQEALESVKVLRGLIPICSYCKQIRSDEGAWEAIESYITQHSEAMFSHGVCPKCMREHHSEFED